MDENENIEEQVVAKLELLKDTKKRIKETLNEKNAGIKDVDPFSTYPAKIANMNLVDNQDPITVNPTTSNQVVTPTQGKTGLSQVTVNAVTSSIDQNIVAENIKEGTTILGVQGNYSGLDTSDATAVASDILKDKTAYVNGQKLIGTLEQSGGTGDVKLFETVEEMQADPNPQEGDLAVVYRKEANSISATTVFSKAVFPKKVVLTNPITDSDYIDMRFESIDRSSGYFDTSGNISKTRFMLDCFSSSGSYRVEYESEDGITYNRTTLEDPSGEATGDSLDFGIEIGLPEYEQDRFDSRIGDFIKAETPIFDGFYWYQLQQSIKNEFAILPLDSSYYNFSDYSNDNKYQYKSVYDGLYKGNKIYTENDIGQKINDFIDNYVNEQYASVFLFLNREKTFIYVLQRASQNIYYDIDKDLFYAEIYKSIQIDSILYKYNLEGELIEKTILNDLFEPGSTKYNYELKDQYWLIGDNIGDNQTSIKILNKDYISAIFVRLSNLNHKNIYVTLPTQLNSDKSDLFPEKIAYGSSEVIIGDGSLYDKIDYDELINKRTNSGGHLLVLAKNHDGESIIDKPFENNLNYWSKAVYFEKVNEPFIATAEYDSTTNITIKDKKGDTHIIKLEDYWDKDVDPSNFSYRGFQYMVDYDNENIIHIVNIFTYKTGTYGQPCESRIYYFKFNLIDDSINDLYINKTQLGYHYDYLSISSLAGNGFLIDGDYSIFIKNYYSSTGSYYNIMLITNGRIIKEYSSVPKPVSETNKNMKYHQLIEKEGLAYSLLASSNSYYISRTRLKTGEIESCNVPTTLNISGVTYTVDGYGGNTNLVISTDNEIFAIITYKANSQNNLYALFKINTQEFKVELIKTIKKIDSSYYEGILTPVLIHKENDSYYILSGDIKLYEFKEGLNIFKDGINISDYINNSNMHGLSRIKEKWYKDISDKTKIFFDDYELLDFTKTFSKDGNYLLVKTPTKIYKNESAMFSPYSILLKGGI